MSVQLQPIFTIGHSTHPLGVFVGLLRQHGVTALADVRSAPYSRFNSQFNREDLKRDLKAHGIDYVFLGKELGARSDDPSCYEQGKVKYGRLAQTALFKTGIERVLSGAQKRRIALMCAEKDPLDCHRTLLVSRALVAEGASVSHILADGKLEPHAQAMSRLLGVVGLPEVDMFRTHDELLKVAYELREQKIAYVDESLSESADRVQG